MQKVLGSYKIPPEGPSTFHLDTMTGLLCSQMCNLDASARPVSSRVLRAVQRIARDNVDS